MNTTETSNGSQKFYDAFQDSNIDVLINENMINNNNDDIDVGLHEFFAQQDGNRMSQQVQLTGMSQISEMEDNDEGQETDEKDDFASFEDQYHQMIKEQLGNIFEQYCKYKNKQINNEDNQSHEFQNMCETVKEFQSCTKKSESREVKLGQQVRNLEIDPDQHTLSIQDIDFAPICSTNGDLEIVGTSKLYHNPTNIIAFRKSAEIIAMDELLSDENSEDSLEIITSLNKEETQPMPEKKKSPARMPRMQVQQQKKPPRRDYGKQNSKLTNFGSVGRSYRDSVYQLASAGARNSTHHSCHRKAHLACRTPISAAASGGGSKGRFSKPSEPSELYHTNNLPSIPSAGTQLKYMSKRHLQQNQQPGQNIIILDQRKSSKKLVNRCDSSGPRIIYNQKQKNGLAIIENKKYNQLVTFLRQTKTREGRKVSQKRQNTAHAAQINQIYTQNLTNPRSQARNHKHMANKPGGRSIPPQKQQYYLNQILNNQAANNLLTQSNHASKRQTPVPGTAQNNLRTSKFVNYKERNSAARGR